MLHTLGLKQGQWEPINGEARHINIVLAAGVIDVRVKKRGSSAYATEMVGGMALELPVFDSVEIRSDTDQVVKVWVSELPLNYSPDSTRELGANALRSSVGYVYSGYPYELLPAEVGRNRITLTPSQDIYIGGTNVSPKNGVLLPAGKTFTMATQGAVWALEQSGNFEPYFTALVDVNQSIDAFVEGGIGDGFSVFYENSARTRAWGWRSNKTSTRFYEYDPKTKAYAENYTTFYSNGAFGADAGEITVLGDDKLSLYTSRYCGQFDLNTGQYDDYSDGLLSIDDIAGYVVAGQYHYVAMHNGEIYRAPDRTTDWALYASAPPNTIGTKWRLSGFDVFDDGRVVWANEYQLFYTIDGTAWVQGERGDMLSQAGLQIDRANDILYAFDNDVLRKSFDNGASWHVEFDTNDFGLPSRAPSAFKVVNGCIVAAAFDWIAFRNPVTGEWAAKEVNENSRQRNEQGISISPSGLINFYFKPNNGNEAHGAYLNIQGERIPVGGLPIAIMSEVN